MDRKEAIEVVREIVRNNLQHNNSTLCDALETLIPELVESEYEKTRRDLINFVKLYGDNYYGQIAKAYAITWLEKQEDKDNQVIFPVVTFDDILALECCMKTAEKDEELYNQLQNLFNRLHDAYHGEKTNPYSGVSFEYNGHTWGMCARDNGVDISLDKQLFKHIEEPGEKKETLCDKCRREQPSQSCQDITELGRCALEHQCEQKSNNVKPRFNVGDWVVHNGVGVYKIVEVCESWYEVISYNDGTGIQYSIGFDKENDCHLWTMQDVKNGDVLANTAGCILIANDNESCLCYLDKNEKFHAHNNKWFFSKFTDNVLTPATKEQRNLLFSKMKAALYQWDPDEKKLKIIDWSKLVKCNNGNQSIAE